MPVEKEQQGGVRVVRMASGSANVLSRALGAAIGEAIASASGGAGCKAIILAGSGRMFCGGGDLGDLGAVVGLRRLLSAIETSSVPVIMALHGLVLGGGLELAMAGHLRIADRSARLSLPEIGMGLLPGLGGTQRLPRLVGAGPALEIMLSGRPVEAPEALAMGLIDRIAEGDVVDAALKLVRACDLPFRRTSDLPPPADVADATAQRRARLAGGLNRASDSIVQCVAGLTDDFEGGLANEADRFAELAASEASRGLRHAFFGGRAITRHPNPLSPGSKASIAAHLLGALGRELRVLQDQGTGACRIEGVLQEWGLRADLRCGAFAGGPDPVAARRHVDDREIVDRCLLAMINKGAQIVADRETCRPIDIDMVSIESCGFARERGGPMFQADLIGMKQLGGRLRSCGMTPAPLIERLAATECHFAALNS